MAVQLQFADKPDDYGADKIKVLKGLEGVRKRPGMYIGDTGKAGLHHLFKEILDNSIDEAMAGYANQILVTIHKDGSISVKDDGRGIPVGINKAEGVSAATLAMTVLHAGGKFDNSSYKTSGGLHGVGASVVNALSKWLKLTIHRDGFVWTQEFEHGGHPIAPLAQGRPSKATGTTTRFLPDDTIFVEDGSDFDVETVRDRVQNAAFLNPRLELTLYIEQTDERTIYLAERFGQIIDFIKLDQSENIGGIIEGTATVADPKGDVEVFFAIQYCKSEDSVIRTFANGVPTPYGGTHESGFGQALLRAINAYAESNNLVKDPLIAEDVREGLCAAISIRLPEPKFEGQTKEKLGNSEARSAVHSVVYAAIKKYLEEHRTEAVAIVKNAALAAKAREAAAKTRAMITGKKGAKRLTMPGKLHECSSDDPKKCELFLVEGDSAAGTAKYGRQREFQAILALKGKPLNVKKNDLADALKNEEIDCVIRALGCGIGKDFDITKLRYHKIIITNDADVDGSHISTLVLTLIHTFMPELIRLGYVYAAQPPLFRAKRGMKSHYIKDDAALERFKNQHLGENWEYSRFKGLGEMDAEELGETTMDPVKRTLARLTYGLDGSIGSEDVFELLMGKNVEPRAKFINDNAIYATIDV